MDWMDGGDLDGLDGSPDKKNGWMDLDGLDLDPMDLDPMDLDGMDLDAVDGKFGRVLLFSDI